MTQTSPPSKPTSPAGGGSSKPKRPSQRRPRGAHEPSLLHDFIESSKRKDERKRDERRKGRPSVMTHGTTVEFRPQKSTQSSSDGYNDADTHASGDHASSFVSLSSTKICYDDDRSASGLFPVKGSTSIDSCVEHWRAAEYAVCSFTTTSASTTQVDNRTNPETHPYRGRRRSHRSPEASQASSGFLELPHGGDLDDASESSSDYGVFVSDESSAGSSSSGNSEGSSVLWDHIEKRGRHTRHSRSLNESSKSLERSLVSKERKRLKRSAMKVARRFAQVVAGVFALSSLLVYLAFQADFESILDDVAATKSNLMGRRFGNNLVEADKALDDSLLRSRALPVQYNPYASPKPQTSKRAFEEVDSRTTRTSPRQYAPKPQGETTSEKEIEEQLALARERRLRGSGQSQQTASRSKWGQEGNPREEAKTARTQELRAQALRQRMLKEREIRV